MKARLLVVSVLVALVVALATPSFAQVVASDAYQVNYYIQAPCVTPQPLGAPLSALFTINTGQVGSPIDAPTAHGTVCADIYVFDTNQEMLECCSCPVTANGLLAMAVCPNLTGNALTGVSPAIGVIKVVADQPTGGLCDARSINSPVNGGLRSWRTTITGASRLSLVGLSENHFQSAPLTAQEQQFLGQACAFVTYLGSGRGTCRCTAEREAADLVAD